MKAIATRYRGADRIYTPPPPADAAQGIARFDGESLAAEEVQAAGRLSVPVTSGQTTRCWLNSGVALLLTADGRHKLAGESADRSEMKACEGYIDPRLAASAAALALSMACCFAFCAWSNYWRLVSASGWLHFGMAGDELSEIGLIAGNRRCIARATMICRLAVAAV